MNSISIDQNSKRQIERLAAQRQLYSTAKTVFGWQAVVSGPVAVSFAFLVFIFPLANGYTAAWGFLVSICDALWLTPWQKRLRNTAARIQELFDCELFRIPWNDLKAGHRPDPELVKEQSDKYRSREASMPPLTNWYPKEVSSLPLYLARIACQRSNCWWDARQRRRYAGTVLVGLALVFVLLLFLAMGREFTLETFVLKVAAPLSPALILGIRQCTEQFEAANRLDKLKEHADRLWDDALGGNLDAESTTSARTLQDEILENRGRSPLVFDAIFKHFRRDYEVQMNHSVGELVSEAKRRFGLP